MGTRSNQVLGKRCERNLEPQEEEEGVFSRFSDEFIVDELLTRWSFKEAVRASVLSRRWQKLWTHRSFIFDSDCLHYDSKNPNPEERSREQQFVQVVNHCLELHQNPSLNFLCIHFDLDYGFSSLIDGWIQFAFRKGVRCLCLSLQDRLPFSQKRNQCVFPGVETLKKQLSTTSSPLDNYNNCNTSKLLCAGISNLRSFDLTGVDINHEALEYLLSKSPFLETLCLSKCNNLVDLKLPSEAYSLKSVMVTRCRDMKRLVITKSNLTSLSISGSKITLSLENVPLLSLLSLCGEFCEIFLQRLSLHLSLLSQLKT